MRRYIPEGVFNRHPSEGSKAISHRVLVSIDIQLLFLVTLFATLLVVSIIEEKNART